MRFLWGKKSCTLQEKSHRVMNTRNNSPLQLVICFYSVWQVANKIERTSTFYRNLRHLLQVADRVKPIL